MVQQSKKDYLAAILPRYKTAGMAFKRRILDEFSRYAGITVSMPSGC
jgi:hypothetical protein